MKYSTKLRLIPSTMESPVQTRLVEMEKELNSILKRTDMDKSEKIKSYNQLLTRYLNMNRDPLNVSNTTVNEEKIIETLPVIEDSDEFHDTSENVDDDFNSLKSSISRSQSENDIETHSLVNSYNKSKKIKTSKSLFDWESY